jgi:amino acid adenylation domain-containing protein
LLNSLGLLSYLPSSNHWSPEIKNLQSFASLSGNMSAIFPSKNIPHRPRIQGGVGRLVLPASSAQLSLWVRDQLRPHGGGNNLPMAFRLCGDLDVEALTRSFSVLVRRHEVLRTTFCEVGEELMQVIAPGRDLTLRITDLCDLAPAERVARVGEFIRDKAWTPFDLSQGPLMRAELLRVNEKEHVLFLNFHHIVYDHSSDEILMRELLSAYEALAEARQPQLPELVIQYAEYAQWHHEQLRSKRSEGQLAYWRGQLSDLPSLHLPADRPRAGAQTASSGSEPFELSLRQTDALKKLGRNAGATFFVTMLAAFKVLLARYSGQEDIVVGSMVRNHGYAEAQPLIGLFVSPLVLRTKLDGNPTFHEAVQRVRKMTQAAYQNQNVPFESIVEALGPECDLTRNPFYQVVFELKAQPEPYSTRDLRWIPIEMEDRSSMSDLTMTLLDGRDGLRGCLNYNTQLFKAEFVQRMASHFRTLLEGIVAQPEARISELPLLTGSELEQMMVERNATNRDYPTDLGLHQLFEAQATKTPETVAVVYEGQVLTYRQLDQAANALAGRLQALSVGPDALVAILSKRSLELVVAMIAVLKAGGAYLPLDPDHPRERLRFILEDAKPTAVLIQERLKEKLPPALPGPTLCLRERLETTERLTSTSVSPDNLAYVIYTSGSTGQPKGAMIPHRAVCNFLHWIQEAHSLGPQDRILQKSAYTFDFSIPEFFWPLVTGATMVLAREGAHADSDYLIEIINAQRISTINFVPTTLALFLENPKVALCPSLQRVFCGGEALATDLVARFFERLPQAELYNGYGPTETTVFATTWRCRDQEDQEERSVPIGRPLANVQVYLLDANTRPVPVGVVGELYIGGCQLARGYLNRPELTARHFPANPFGPGRLYRTGDLARYRSDGAIEYLGRTDFQVKIRGLRIELQEIEAVLKKHPAVRDCVVVVRQDGMEAVKRLAAYIVASGISPDDLRLHAQQTLPGYMVPSVLVFLDELPLTANGKLDRRALPEPVSVQSEKGQVPPRTALETQLVAIWEKVLSLESIGITDNFFQLGGDSLRAVRIFAEIEHTLGKRLPLATLFETPTIERVAEKMWEETRSEEWGPLVAFQLQGERPPFFGIHGRDGNVLFYRKFTELLGKEQPFYGLQAQGLDGQPIARTSVEAIAAYYLEEMRKVQPHGPYLLGGYSFGGVAAYEMARRLRAAGEEVDLVALFDAPNPAKPRRVRSWTKVIRDTIRRVLSRGTTPSRVLQFLAQHCGSKAGDMLLRWNETFHKLTLGRTTSGGRNPPELLDLHVQMVHERAFLAYRPLPYPGKVTLFRTVAEDSAYEVDPDLGWGALAQGGTEIHYVPGIHATIFSDENVPDLARKVEECIHSVLSKKQRGEAQS